jgi:adenylosuccinate lyase
MSLHAISPIDGRYQSKTEVLSAYFSEYALIRERCRIEIEYLIALNALALPHMPAMTADQIKYLRICLDTFGEDDAKSIKEIESRTNHDVKAVEYFLKEKLDAGGMGPLREWVHFALTSQDINNTSVPALTKHAVEDQMIPTLQNLTTQLAAIVKEWHGVPVLARTHGQPASPTTMGKEIRVFHERLTIQIDALKNLSFYGKFGGATGNFNAHKVVYPDVDWRAFADGFLASLGLKREQTTTQIDHYDHLAELFHCWMRINTILIDLSRDLWAFISMEFITQRAVAGEVGSSTMPHKVNPIDFENAEGNLGLANAIFGHLAEKLPVSRLQRDLTDSTVLRNIGVPFAHTLIALRSLEKGLSKITLNRPKLEADLDRHWIILAEPIQTILRREGVAEPYELLKSLTRGASELSREDFIKFIESLDVSDSVKDELRQLTPQNYTGYD